MAFLFLIYSQLQLTKKVGLSIQLSSNAQKRFDFRLVVFAATINPIACGGGGGVWPTPSDLKPNPRTRSPRISKISDFFFMPFGQIVAKFQVD